MHEIGLKLRVYAAAASDAESATIADSIETPKNPKNVERMFFPFNDRHTPDR